MCENFKSMWAIYRGETESKCASAINADKLKQFFVESGIDANRIVSQGHGEKRHIASNTSNRGRAQNRRVVIRMER